MFCRAASGALPDARAALLQATTDPTGGLCPSLSLFAFPTTSGSTAAITVASLTSHRQAGLAVGRAAKMNHSHAAQLPTEWMASLRSSSTDAVLLRIPHTYGGHQPAANPRIAPDGELMHTKYVATNKRH